MPGSRKKRFLLALAVLAVLLLVAVVALPLLIDADSYRETLRVQAETALGRPVRLDALHLRVLPRLALTADDLALQATPDEGGGDLLTARRIVIGARIMPLLQGRVEITRIIIQQPELKLRRAADGSLLLPLPRAEATPPAPAQGTTESAMPSVEVKLLALRDGVVTLEEEGATRTMVEEFNLRLHDVALDRPLEFAAAGLWVEPDGRRRHLELDGTLSYESKGDDLILALSAGAIRSGDSSMELTGSLTGSGSSSGLSLELADVHLADTELKDLLASAGMSLPGELAGEPLRGTAALSWQEGKAVLSPLQMDLFGGRLKGKATLHTDQFPASFHLEGDLSELEAGPLLRTLLDMDILRGRLGGNLTLQGAGGTYEEVVRSSQGHGEIELRSGHLDGLDVLASISRTSGVFGEDTVKSLATELAEGGMEFDQLGGRFKIQSGRLVSPDLLLKTPDLKLTGGGTLDLLSGNLDGSFLLSLSKEISASMSNEGSRAARLFWNKDTERVTMPLKLSGPVSAPEATIDWRAAAGSYLKNEMRDNPEADLGGTLRQLLDDSVKDALQPEGEEEPAAAPPAAETEPDTVSGDPAAAVTRVRWGGSILAKDLKLDGWVAGTRLAEAILTVTDNEGREITRIAPLPEVRTWIAGNPGAEKSTRIPWEAKVDGKRLLVAKFPLLVTLTVTTQDGREVEARRPVDR